jgi:hypothetical protein
MCPENSLMYDFVTFPAVMPLVSGRLGRREIHSPLREILLDVIE